MRKKINYFNKQKGFSIALLLGLIVLLSVIGYLGSTIYTSIIGGNQRSNLSIQSSQSLTQAAYILTTETTKNASGIPVASAILTNAFSPTGGGIIPSTSAAPKLDSYGSNIGYCVNSAVNQSDPVFAIISAGANKTFNTTCAQALVGTAIGDDKVINKSVTNILQGVGGTVYFGDPVPTVADLANLTATSLKPGQLRTVLADSSIYINSSGAVGSAAWTKAGAAGGSGSGGFGGGPTVMYLGGVPSNGTPPAACPTGWTQADYQVSNTYSGSSGVFVYTRTCLNTGAYTVIYLGGSPNNGLPAAACPTGWTQADHNQSIYSSSGTFYTRTCFIAQTGSGAGSSTDAFPSCYDTRFSSTSQNLSYGNSFILGATCVQNGYVVAYKTGIWCADPAFKAGTYAIGTDCNGKGGYGLKYIGLNSGTPLFMYNYTNYVLTYDNAKTACSSKAMFLPTNAQASIGRSIWGPSVANTFNSSSGIWLIDSNYSIMTTTGSITNYGNGNTSTYYCFADS